MTPEISAICSNFIEISSAVLGSRADETPHIVADVCGTRLFDAKKGCGLCLRKFYNFIWFFDGGESERSQCKKSLQATAALFHKEQARVQEYLQQYKKYVSDCCSGVDVDEKLIEKAGKAITAWHDHVLPFFKLVRRQDPRLLRLFHTHLVEEQKEQKAQHSVFNFSPEVTQGCKQYQSFIRLRGHVNIPLPFAALTNLHREYLTKEDDLKQNAQLEVLLREHDRKEYSDKEIAAKELWQKEIGRLLSDIQTKSAQIGVRDLNEFLHSFITHLLRDVIKVDSSSISVAMHVNYFIFALQHKPFSKTHPQWGLIFTRDDEKHLRWRASLRPGSRVQCNDKMIVLGQQIGRKIASPDRNIHFEIQEDPHRIVSIGFNKAILGIKHQIYSNFVIDNKWKSYSETIAVVKIEEIDTRGCCAIVERVQRSFLEIGWGINPPQTVLQRSVVNNLANYLSMLTRQPEIPNMLSTKFIMYNDDGSLKFWKIPSLVPNDFVALIRFVGQVANANPHVYQQLIETSQLHTHQFAKFFAEVVEVISKQEIADRKTFNFKEFAAQLAARRNIEDPRITDQAGVLARKVSSLQAKCFKLLEQNAKDNPRLDANKVRGILADSILNYYHSTKSVGIIWQRKTAAPVIVSQVLKTIK